MIQTPVRNPLDDVADFLATAPSDEQVLAYHFCHDMQERLHQLLDRNREDELSYCEKRELEDFLRANRMMATLKTKTRLRQRGIET